MRQLTYNIRFSIKLEKKPLLEWGSQQRATDMGAYPPTSTLVTGDNIHLRGVLTDKLAGELQGDQ